VIAVSHIEVEGPILWKASPAIRHPIGLDILGRKYDCLPQRGRGKVEDELISWGDTEAVERAVYGSE
jgi:hypothetical protein